MDEKLKKLDEKVLAHGEVTGHAHRVEVDVYQDEQGHRLFSGRTKITHEEHNPVEIPNGEWISGIVREYDHWENEARAVQD